MNSNNLRNIRRFPRRSILLAMSLLILSGCTVHPVGEREERAAAARQGRPFEKRFESRPPATLPANPTPDDLVAYALLNNADLEQKYWQWRAAIEQIPQDGTQTASLNIGAGTTINKGRASWGSSTLTLSNDPMTDIKVPSKLDAAARQSLENARGAGRRFVKAKYDLRNKTLTAFYDYALTAELIGLEQRNQQLLQTIAGLTTAENRAGAAGQQEALKASNEVDLSANELAIARSQLLGQRAAINALMGRSADAELPIPDTLPPARAMNWPDEDLVALAAARNPELMALADEIHGRREGIRLAKLQYVPDFNLSIGTDLLGNAQSILGQATIPLFRYEALKAAVAQTEANLRASEAMRRQTANDLAAQVITDIAVLRDADRQIDLLVHTILPRMRQMVKVSRLAYESGHASLLDLLDSQRSLIAIERMLADIKITREKRVIDLEAITASDLSQRLEVSASR